MIDFKFIMVVLVAYMLGNISPSTILGKLNGIDIKKVGSGNAGTTNTLRVLGAKAGIITLVIDISKGVISVLLGYYISTPDAAMWCAFAAFLGHVFPVFLRFKGGKGVAVAFGVLLALNWKIAISLLLIVAICTIITKKVSFSSLIATAAFPIICYFMEPKFIYIGTTMAIIVFIMHRQNIRRMINGEESEISLSWFKKKDEEKDE